eukprot:6224143-Amphidinium_carterae.1
MSFPLFCEICRVSCPSEYQWKQHLEGKRHRHNAARGGQSHAAVKKPMGPSLAALPQVAAARNAGHRSVPALALPCSAAPAKPPESVCGTFVMTKIDNDFTYMQGQKIVAPLPEGCRDAFKRKRDVDLFVKDKKRRGSAQEARKFCAFEAVNLVQHDFQIVWVV